MVGSLTIISPWYLAAFLPLALGLVWSYFRRKNQAVVVPSLLLLRKLPPGSPRAARFRLPPLLFLELLILSLLLLAAAGLRYSGERTRRTILVDNSLSMGLSGTQQKSLLAQAIAKAKKVCLEASEVTIYVTSPSLTQLTSDFTPSGEACPSIDTISLTFAQDNLEAAVGSLARSATNPLWVFSDRSIAPATEEVPTSIIWSQVHTDLEPSNLAISGIHEERGGKAKPSLAMVTVSSFSPQSVQVEIIADRVDAEGAAKKVASVPLTLHARERREVPLSITEWGDVGVRITLATKLTPASDLNPEDNVAWLTRPSAKGISLAYIGPDNPQLGNILQASLTKLPLEEFQKNQRDYEAKFDGFILHKVSLPQRLKKPALLVAPPPLPRYPAQECDGAVVPSRWRTNHPVTRYVNLQNLKFHRALCFAKAVDLVPVITAAQGDILLATHDDTTPMLITGFEIFPFEGRRNLPLSILTLNMLQWVFQGSISEGWRPLEDVGYALKPDFKPIQTTAPLGSLMAPGLYYTLGSSPHRFMAVNYFELTESDPSKQQPVSLPSMSGSEDVDAFGTVDITSRIALAALILVLVEWLFLVRRRGGLLSLRKRTTLARKPGRAS